MNPTLSWVGRMTFGTFLKGLSRKRFYQISQWALALSRYKTHTDIPYIIGTNYRCALDVYLPRHSDPPYPTVISFHGGGWTDGHKENNLQLLTPYFQSQYAVVCPDYRLARRARAPAAAEDARRALIWTLQHHHDFGFSRDQIILSGDSAGGHLALLSAFLPTGCTFDPPGYHPPPHRIAAVVNWYGITDVADLLSGPNQRTYAAEWLDGTEDMDGLASRLSPLSYIRGDLPPVLTLHGDADPVVPYEHAERLHLRQQRWRCR